MGIDIENPGADAADFKAAIRAQALPLPFFGDQTQSAWVRPALTDFPDWLNQHPDGFSLAAAVDNPNGLPMVLLAKQDDDAGYTITARLKDASVAPWTLTVGAAAFAPIHAGIVITYPIALYNVTGDKMVAFDWISGGATDSGKVNIGHFTVASGASALSITEISQGFGFSSADYFEWFRIENDGTNLNFSISPEGKLWFQIHTETIASFIGQVDQIGFGVERLNQSGLSNGASGHDVDAACIIWSWVET